MARKTKKLRKGGKKTKNIASKFRKARALDRGNLNLPPLKVKDSPINTENMKYYKSFFSKRIPTGYTVIKQQKRKPRRRSLFTMKKRGLFGIL